MLQGIQAKMKKRGETLDKKNDSDENAGKWNFI